MSEVSVKAEPRRLLGSRASNRLRAEGLIPATVYGQGTEPASVTVARRDLRQALTTESGLNALITLQVDGDRLLTIVRELQRHPVRNDVTHVDFIVVNRDEAVTVEVPVVLEGESASVKAADGTIDQVLFHLTMSAKPGNIPNEITVDVSGLEVGETLRVGDLTLPAGATAEVDDDEAVAVAQFSSVDADAEVPPGTTPTAGGEVQDAGQAGDVGATEETQGGPTGP